MAANLYSIGHGTRKIEDFVALLLRYGISTVADVRSVPFSRYNPQYNHTRLRKSLAENGIAYLAMGEMLGGRPKDASCYDEKGRLDYEKISRSDFFREGIKQLNEAFGEGICLAIMCSESKPGECHRSKLIGSVLESEGIVLEHIDENGLLKSQNMISGIGPNDSSAPTLFDG